MNQKLRDEFSQRIVSLQQRVDAIHQDFAKGRNADWSEQASERENDEVLNALESEAKVEIQQLANAIQRIDQGNYGHCIQCSELISPERLAVQPSAEKCIQCAD